MVKDFPVWRGWPSVRETIRGNEEDLQASCQCANVSLRDSYASKGPVGWVTVCGMGPCMYEDLDETDRGEELGPCLGGSPRNDDRQVGLDPP